MITEERKKEIREVHFQMTLILGHIIRMTPEEYEELGIDTPKETVLWCLEILTRKDMTKEFREAIQKLEIEIKGIEKLDELEAFILNPNNYKY